MRHLVLVLPVVALVACDRPQKFTPPQDAGPLCENNQQLVNGECRFVCQRDGDCANGERCNLFVGQCETKPAPVDGGMLTGTCTTGAVRCSVDKKAIETCQVDSSWAATTQCPQPGGFCQNEKCLVCQPGAASCTDVTHVAVCLDDGSATRAITCAGTATCQANECRECTPNSFRCNPGNTAVQQCQRGGDETQTWHWVNVGDNFDGSCITGTCRQGGGNGYECTPPACFPGQIQCKDARTAQTCGATGNWVDSTCPGAQECQGGVCVDECADAVAAKSYFGCDYWTAITDNSVDKVFKGGVTTGQGALNAPSEFAFVVANRSVNVANVTVSRYFGGALQNLPVVAVPGRNDPATKGVAIIRVPWQSIAKNADTNSMTGLARYGYRLQSTKPLTVYQFNPLGASMVDQTRTCTTATQCTGASPNPTCVGGKCNFFSYSNDASLLLPAHILGTSYVTMSADHIVLRPSGPNSTANAAPWGNGFITIVGTQDNTMVTVKASAKTVAGPGIASIARGGTITYTLNSYDVIQLASDNPTDVSAARNFKCGYNKFNQFNDEGTCNALPTLCDYSCNIDNADLTGTIVTSDKPVSVFGGSMCTLFGPADPACDHIEEQQFPFVTWGKDFVAVRSAPLRLKNNTFATVANAGPDYYKIVAGCPASQCPTGTAITLSPPPAAADVLSPGHCLAGSLQANTCTLAGGSYVEFRSKANFTISATQPIAVGQFFAGQDATTAASTTNPVVQGDPSFILLPPIQQWRSNYTVLTAPGTLDNYVGLVIDSSKVQSVTIDGTAVPGFTTVSGAIQAVNAKVGNGTHVINVVSKAGVSPPAGAGVTVYGFDQYVSYGYTGGLDLQSIVTGINPGG
ncbi:MAG: IgGFc-binding protein [Archangiaceae bacterium]|nr:IgGFc-binding protein [Archangiaceae bacterium]